MIDVFDLYQDFISWVNTQVGGFVPPQTVFTRWVNNVSYDLWDELTRKSFKSDADSEWLIPFLKSKNLVVQSRTAQYGVVPFPKDYERYSACRVLVSGNSCCPDKSVDNGKCDNGDPEWEEKQTEEYYNNLSERMVENIESPRWASVLSHSTKCPTMEKPKITEIEGVIRVAPRQVTVIVLDYWVKPKLATFVYTLAPGNVQNGSGDEIIYNANAIQKLEWSATVKNEFLKRLQDKYAVYVRDQAIPAIAAVNKQGS